MIQVLMMDSLVDASDAGRLSNTVVKTSVAVLSPAIFTVSGIGKMASAFGVGISVAVDPQVMSITLTTSLRFLEVRLSPATILGIW
jgi:hypothetical protein